MLAALKEADDAMARFKRLERGLLTIGMVSTAKYFVPHLLARFHQEHPGVDVRLRVVGNREQLVALMQTGEVDLSIMGRPPQELATRTESFAAPPAGLRRPARPPAAGAGAGAGGGTRSPTRSSSASMARARATAMEGFFAEHHFEPRIAMEMSSNETIKQAVMAGMGLSFLSLHTVGLELRSGLLTIARHRRHAGDADVEHRPPGLEACCRRRPRPSATSSSSRGEALPAGARRTAAR